MAGGLFASLMIPGEGPCKDKANLNSLHFNLICQLDDKQVHTPFPSDLKKGKRKGDMFKVDGQVDYSLCS
jgi:hypothetical protein